MLCSLPSSKIRKSFCSRFETKRPFSSVTVTGTITSFTCTRISVEFEGLGACAGVCAATLIASDVKSKTRGCMESLIRIIRLARERTPPQPLAICCFFMTTVASFGEIMLRLAPPGFERFLQSPQFLATWGGGEANVAVALSQFGNPSRYITVLPPNNPIVDAFIGEMRRFGVDSSFIVRQKGRLGIYFVEPGANQRASKVVYDR